MPGRSTSLSETGSRRRPHVIVPRPPARRRGRAARHGRAGRAGRPRGACRGRRRAARPDPRPACPAARRPLRRGRHRRDGRADRPPPRRPARRRAPRHHPGHHRHRHHRPRRRALGRGHRDRRARDVRRGRPGARPRVQGPGQLDPAPAGRVPAGRRDHPDDRPVAARRHGRLRAVPDPRAEAAGPAPHRREGAADPGRGPGPRAPRRARRRGDPAQGRAGGDGQAAARVPAPPAAVGRQEGAPGAQRLRRRRDRGGGPARPRRGRRPPRAGRQGRGQGARQARAHQRPVPRGRLDPHLGRHRPRAALGRAHRRTRSTSPPPARSWTPTTPASTT